MLKTKFLIFAFLFAGIIFAPGNGDSCPPGMYLDPATGQCIASVQPPPGGIPVDATIASGQISAALSNLCVLIKNMLGIGMMFMVVSSALVYSIGQVMGAETRARASVWATSMFNGAIIAALIYLLVPFVLTTLLTSTGVTPTCTPA